MNAQIGKLAVGALVLMIALIVGTTYWQTWASAGLADRQDNQIQRVAQFTIKRGRILAADGTVLATNRAKKVAGKTLYFRRYPQRGLFAQLVGYSTQSRSRTGLERSENDYLTGSNTNLNTVLKTALDRLKGVTIKGNDLHLTVRPGPQRIALDQLGGRCGAVVALDTRTGAVLTMASAPTFNPNLIERNFGQVARVRADCAPAAPLLNRATAGLFTPGSTFKLVTVSAALTSGRFTPESPFYDPGYCVEYGQHVSNASNADSPGSAETFGHTTLFQGLVHSINSVFCNVGIRMGGIAILDYAKKLGFYSLPPLETPANERAASGLYNHGRLFFPRSDAQVDPGRLAFGQERMLVTPLQMAMVAAAIANGGVVMRPYAVDRVTTPGGSLVTRTRPDALGRVMNGNIAAEITSMMIGVVQSGTGTAAQIPGVPVAGKTGTAETGVQGVNTTWFVCFAPADHPRYAVAVVVEKQHGYGGSVAAPIAKAVMQALLGRG